MTDFPALGNLTRVVVEVDLFSGRENPVAPGRCAGLARARERWRLANAPPYLRRAIEARPLLRRNLAAILVWEVPELRDLQRGPVLVFEDVVQLAEQGDVVTVTRSGVMRGDSVTRRFGPSRAVTEGELRGVLERLATVLGVAPPRWCDGVAEGACVTLPTPVDGAAAAVAVRSVAGKGGEPCQ